MHTSAAPTPTFLLPPAVRNAQGQARRAGFEFEFAGLDLLSVHFGGTLDQSLEGCAASWEGAGSA